MWNEHFGIGVVEMMASGLITIAHNSGGPKADIIIPLEPSKSRTGFLASTEEEYADALFEALKDDPRSSDYTQIRSNGRISAQRFSDEVFLKSFQSVMMSTVLK